MKKNIAMLALVALFAVSFSPIVSYAQVASSTPNHNSAYIQGLQNALNQALQLLSQLITELQTISANQATLQTAQNALSTKTEAVANQVTQIVKNTNPVMSFGSPDPVQSAPVDQSGLVIDSIASTSETDMGGIHGVYFISVSILDSSGNDVDGLTTNKDSNGNFTCNPNYVITMTASDNIQAPYEPSWCPNSIPTIGSTNWSKSFVYVPSSAGEKTVVFTTPTLSATTTIEVQ